MEAKYYTKKDKNRVQCLLCPHKCVLEEDKTGICRVRKNVGGHMITGTGNFFSSVAIDPIEKKPLYHFYPGMKILSVGSYGCNMRCSWCQNCNISQVASGPGKHISTEDLVNLAKESAENIGVAYTYNEPSIAFETNLVLAKQINHLGLKNVLVTNGYISTDPLMELLPFTNAVNLDVKSFDHSVHKKNTSAILEHIIHNAELIYKEKVHLEITMLVVPEVSDNLKDFERFVAWIKSIDVDIPLHISRYFPQYNYHKPATSTSLIRDLADLANSHLSYVYIGNMPGNSYSNTYCPVCTNEIISRTAYSIGVVGADSNGNCLECGKQVFVMK